ncbi:hypothetical protein NPIL_577151 [Nephila pilipes]|uniref:Uncharacterized protein n=1 Tax=Nephila pilipes TaxID=299642 RepID=A0A8X6NVA8_NEPPI|nr:hypothetical protein NPIL_577151 [Nephila pilipes]
MDMKFFEKRGKLLKIGSWVTHQEKDKESARIVGREESHNSKISNPSSGLENPIVCYTIGHAHVPRHFPNGQHSYYDSAPIAAVGSNGFI